MMTLKDKKEVNFMEEKYKYMQNDKDIVLAAVQQNGEVLKYVSEELQNDKDLLKNNKKDYDEDLER